MFLLPAVAGLVLGHQTAPIEVPFRISEDAIMVDALVNGSKVSLLFDTGFGGSVLISDSVDIGPSTGTTTLRDFVGEFDAKTVKIKTLKLGQMTIDSSGMSAVQQSMAGMSFGYNTHTDGLIGLG